MARYANKRVSTDSESNAVPNCRSEYMPVTTPSTHSSAPERRKKPTPLRVYTAMLAGRRLGGRPEPLVIQSTTGVSPAQIQALPTENRRRGAHFTDWTPVSVPAYA